MKGIMQASAFYVVLMGISAGLMLLISLEHMRITSMTNLKQSLQESAHLLSELDINERESALEDILYESLSIRKPSNETYEVEVLGFIADPIALRVAITVTPHYLSDDMHYRYEESLIEVES